MLDAHAGWCGFYCSITYPPSTAFDLNQVLLFVVANVINVNWLEELLHSICY